MDNNDDINKLKKEFNRLYLLVKHLETETEKLEGPNGYIQHTFKEWDEKTFKNMFRNYNDYNIVINQENDEISRLKSNDNTSLRFFSPYYDNYSSQIAKGNLPYFLKSKKVNLEIDMPDSKSDDENFQKAQNQYINMSKEQRLQEESKVLKSLATLYAREANIFNRFKTSEKVEFEYSMKRKDIAITRFLKYAILYNSKVPEEEQLAFGINDSEKGPLLEASIPGYTRLSVHFGTFRNCKDILNNVNDFLNKNNEKKYFPTFQNGNINIKAVFARLGYDLPKFYIINTGIINRMKHANSEIYEKQIRGKNENSKVTPKRVEIFANFMYPDLNDREIFYLAEKAEFGKKHLEDLKDILKEREERRKIARENKTNLRSIYIQQELEEIPDKNKQLQKINELYLRYLETGEIDSNVTLDKYISLLEKSNIDENLKDIFLKSKEKDMTFEEILEVANTGKEIPKDLFSSKFIEEKEPNFLFELQNKDIPPKLNTDKFKTIFNNLDLKGKIFLLLRTIEGKFTLQDNTKIKNPEYQQKSKDEQNKIEELVLEEVVKDTALEDYGEMFVDILSDASDLIECTNNDPDNKSEQIRLVKNLWDNYEFILSTNSDVKEISSKDKEEFKETLYSYWVDDEIVQNFENLNTETYNQMKESAYKKGVKNRNIVEQAERQNNSNSKDGRLT